MSVVISTDQCDFQFTVLRSPICKLIDQRIRKGITVVDQVAQKDEVIASGRLNRRAYLNQDLGIDAGRNRYARSTERSVFTQMYIGDNQRTLFGKE